LVRILPVHKKECGIITEILDFLLRDVLHILSSCRHPLCAVSVVNKLLDVNTKYRQMAHTTEYLEKSLGAAESRGEMLKAVKEIYVKYMTVSRDLDQKQEYCERGGSRSGSCDRIFLLDRILGTVISVVSQILNSLGIDIDNFFLGLQMVLDNLLSLNVHLFEQIPPMDRYENNLRHKKLYPMMIRLQNHQYIPYEEVYENYANILKDDMAKFHYMQIAGLPVQGYILSNHHITCKNNHGDDISLGLHSDAILKLNILCVLRFNVPHLP